MDSILKSTKIPVFEGNKDKFSQWAYTFLSICAISGCKDALVNENFAVPLENEVLDPTDAADVFKATNRKANATAYALLTVVVKHSTGFQAIRNGVTKDLPNGSAREAWKNLIRIYQPKSTTQTFELEQKFNHCQLE
jgi:hypothetical protein